MSGKFKPTTLSILSGIPNNKFGDPEDPNLPEYNDSELEGGITTDCTQQCFFQITPLTLDVQKNKIAIFAFADDFKHHKFPVNHPEGGVEEICKCAIIQYVQQLDFPGWMMYFTLPGDARAQFIVVPTQSDVRVAEQKYHNQVVVSGAQLLKLGNLDKKNLEKVAVVNLFTGINAEDTPTVNKALQFMHRSNKNDHDCSSQAGDVIFTVGEPKIPEVPNANSTNVNKLGKKQHGSSWKDVTDAVYRNTRSRSSAQTGHVGRQKDA